MAKRRKSKGRPKSRRRKSKKKGRPRKSKKKVKSRKSGGRKSKKKGSRKSKSKKGRKSRKSKSRKKGRKSRKSKSKKKGRPRKSKSRPRKSKNLRKRKEDYVEKDFSITNMDSNKILVKGKKAKKMKKGIEAFGGKWKETVKGWVVARKYKPNIHQILEEENMPFIKMTKEGPMFKGQNGINTIIHI